MNRRGFLASTLAAAPTLALARTRPAAGKRILLRSSWQTVNIGDIAHTPGMLRLLEQYLPECDVTLWPSSVDNGVDAMLKKRFPKLAIMEKTGEAKSEAFKTHDFLLHGSGPGIVGQASLIEWHEKTGKPYGIGGVTWSFSDEGLKVINNAKFAFFRDSVSLGVAKDHGATCPILEFGPDATFACDLVDQPAADGWLKEVGLEPDKFVCCFHRRRKTPYWEVKPNTPFNAEADALNEKMKEHDAAPVRDAVIAVVQQTPYKVLLAPEDATQMKVHKETIYDRLPDDVKPRVVWRPDYWLTDFAQGVYNRSLCIFGSEQHSPIMAIGHGIPAIVCRFKEQTSKGFMWRDIGLNDWLFDHDLDEPAARLTPTLLGILADYPAAKAKAAAAKAVADDRMKHMMDVLRQSMGI
jgi:polysaccharide pyruvyl transferase WcaK-like protein